MLTTVTCQRAAVLRTTWVVVSTEAVIQLEEAR